MKKLILVFLVGMIGGGAMGQIMFQKTYEGIYKHSTCGSIKKTTDGGYIIGGWTSNVNYDTVDGYLIKTDAYGEIMWTKGYGGIEAPQFFGADQTSDGGYIAAGYIWLYNGEMYIVKTDSIGDTLWTRYHSSNEYVTSTYISATSDGGCIISGWGEPTIGTYFILLKYDSNGNLDWGAGGSSFNQTSNMASSVVQTLDGGYIFSGNSGDYGNFLGRTDNNGNMIWLNAYLADGNTVSFNSVVQTNDGGFAAVGFIPGTGTRVFFLKTDNNGNPIFSKTFGGTQDDEATSIKQTSDGGYIITGFTNSFGAGSYDCYLIKTDSLGNLLWSKTYGGVGYEQAVSVLQANDNGYVVLGNIGGNDGFNWKYYLIKTDSLGNSGCDETNPPTHVTTPITTIIDPNTSTGVGPGFNDNGPSINVESGGLDSILCFACNTPAVPGPISGNTLVCYGSVQTYSIDSVPNATSYIWTLPTGWTGSSTSTSITVTVDTPSANISVVSQNSCSISTTTRTLVVSVVIAPNQPGPITGADTLCETSTSTYSIAPVAGATSYTWTLPSGWSGSSSTNSITITTGNAGTGYVTVTADNFCGSSPPDSFLVMVFICSGINTPANANEITLYPNPNDGRFAISNLRFMIYDLRITDVTGRVVYQQSINNSKGAETISLPLSNGVYYWEIKTQDGIAGKGKLIIIRD